MLKAQLVKCLPPADRIAEEEQGIIPRVITGMYDLLREALEERPNVSYTVRCQFLEIYGEDIHDLLEPAGSTVTIREGQNGEVNVHGAKEMLVQGAEVGSKVDPIQGGLQATVHESSIERNSD